MLVVEALKECQRFLSQKGSQASPTAYPIHKTNCLCRFDFLLASPPQLRVKSISMISWEAFVIQAPDSGPELSIQDSDNVNFDGPKDCYERKARCGLFQISLDPVQANRHFDFEKYVDGETQNSSAISKEAGQLDGMPTYFIKLPKDQRLVIVKYNSSIFRISYGPNDHKPTDKTLEEIFNRMLSTVKFKK